MSERQTTLLSGVLLLAGILLGLSAGSAYPRTPLLALALSAGGWYVVPKGWRALRRRSVDLNFVMTIADMGASLLVIASIVRVLRSSNALMDELHDEEFGSPSVVLYKAATSSLLHLCEVIEL